MFTSRSNIIALLTALVAVVVIGITIALPRRSAKAQQDLANLLPEISSITIYDFDGNQNAETTKTQLSSQTTASFPPKVFTHAAASATHTNQPALWKGSSLAIIILRDGTERRAAFSYYGGFFKLHGAPGHFRVPDAGRSDFHTTYIHLVQEQFIPKRFAKNRTNTATMGVNPN